MKTLMTILAAMMFVTCQNQNSLSADFGGNDLIRVAGVVGEELQMKFESEAFAVVLENTKCVTDAVVLENSRRLSEFAEIRRQGRINQDSREASGQSIEIGENISGNCGNNGHCRAENIRHWRIGRGLRNAEIYPLAGFEKGAALTSNFECNRPTSRKLSEIYPLREIITRSQLIARRTDILKLYTF